MVLKRILAVFIPVMWLLAAGAWAAPPEDDFVLIVNVANTLVSISRKEAERIFLSKKRSWSEGAGVAVVINENPEIYNSFCAAVLRRTPHQFLIFQKKMLFRGQGMPPSKVKTDKEVVAFVTSHTGGLGYVSPEAVTSAVKILSIVQ